LRLSHTAGLVEASSVTATGCSITSAATVSTAGATGSFTSRSGFFTAALLGLALATVRFVAADFAALRGLPRLAEFPFRSFARFGSFDCSARMRRGGLR
jgi:hypothetical protein